MCNAFKLLASEVSYTQRNTAYILLELRNL